MQWNAGTGRQWNTQRQWNTHGKAVEYARTGSGTHADRQRELMASVPLTFSAASSSGVGFGAPLTGGGGCGATDRSKQSLHSAATWKRHDSGRSVRMQHIFESPSEVIGAIFC